MRRIKFLTLLVPFALNINAQGFARLDSMIKRLDINQPISHTRANYGRGQITDSYSFHMFYSESCTPECNNPSGMMKSPNAEGFLWYNKHVNEKNDSNLNAIREELDRLLPMAEESYHFESHKKGGDTINYSICLKAGSDVFKRNRETGVIYYLNGMETIQFDYRTEPIKNCDKHKRGYGMFRYERNEQLPSGESELFNWEAYFSLIKPLLTQEGIASRDFRWAQDNDPEYMSGNPFEDYCSKGQITNAKGKTTEGETNGTMYIIPKDKKQLANSILKSINEISLQYINEHPEQEYTYYYVESFLKLNKLDELLNARISHTPKTRSSIYCAADEQSYYIFVTRTQGALWIPREFTKLKSMVNGKKEYFE